MSDSGSSGAPAGIVDELRLWIFPVVVGDGQRLFEDIDLSEQRFELADTRKLDNGSVILTSHVDVFARRLGA
jgi:dihydrofolate reductase